MQELVFEAVWNRTISDADRYRIKEAFQKAVLSDAPAVQFSPLWQAINHKGELLVSVIIHNKSEEPFPFKHQTVNYKSGAEIISRQIFSLPFIVKGQTSMPWTFIFPRGSIISIDNRESGKLELEKSYDPD